MLMMFSQTTSMIKFDFESRPVAVATLSSLPASMWCSTMMLSWPFLTFPRAKRRQGGSWNVATKMGQNNEKHVEPKDKIEVAMTVAQVLFGVGIGFTIWLFTGLPYVIKAIIRFFRSRLLFGGPLQLIQSIWDILMIPLVESSQNVQSKDEDSTAYEKRMEPTPDLDGEQK
jgi:hypothetical protein